MEPAVEMETPMDGHKFTTQQWLELDQRLRSFIRRRIRQDSDVDDILQDSYHAMQKNIMHMRDSQRFESWLYSIVRNKIIDFYKRKKYTHTDLEKLPLLPEQNETIIDELNPCLKLMMSSLNEQDQIVLNAVHLSSEKIQVFANYEDISLSAAKSRVQRARKHLRKLFEDCCTFSYNQHNTVVGIQNKNNDSCGSVCEDACSQK